MKPYQVTLSDKRKGRINATSAADAIQTALMQNAGLTVEKCELRDISGNGMSFDVPVHVALTVQDIDRLRPKREPKKQSPMGPQGINVPAPWIQDWMDKGKRA